MLPISPCIRCGTDTKYFDKERFYCDDCSTFLLADGFLNDRRKKQMRDYYSRRKKQISDDYRKKHPIVIKSVNKDICHICKNPSNAKEHRVLIFGDEIECNICRRKRGLGRDRGYNKIKCPGTSA